MATDHPVAESLRKQHAEDKAIIVAGAGEFVRVGRALARILESKSYKEVDGYSTFEEYCAVEHRLAMSTAQQKMRSVRYLDALPVTNKGSTIVDPTTRGWNQEQMRQLIKLDSPEEASKVAREAIKAAKKQKKPLTGKFLSGFVDKHRGFGRKKKHAKQRHLEDYLRDRAGDLERLCLALEPVRDDEFRHFGEMHPAQAKDLARIIVRVEKLLNRIWSALP